MSDKIKLVQGDSRPQLQLTLTDETTGLPIDLTATTVTMKFREQGGSSVLDTLTGVITTPLAGQVTIIWNPTTLDVPEGEYEGEVAIVFSDTTIQTVYNLLKFKIRADF